MLAVTVALRAKVLADAALIAVLGGAHVYYMGAQVPARAKKITMSRPVETEDATVPYRVSTYVFDCDGDTPANCDAEAESVRSALIRQPLSAAGVKFHGRPVVLENDRETFDPDSSIYRRSVTVVVRYYKV